MGSGRTIGEHPDATQPNEVVERSLQCVRRWAVAGVTVGDVAVQEVGRFCHREYPRLYGTTLRLSCGDEVVSLANEARSTTRTR